MDLGTLVIFAIIIITAITSYIGFNNRQFFDRYKFSTYAILEMKQYDRMLTAAFLHADLMHLLFNMVTLYFFAPVLVAYVGPVKFLILYLAAIIGGNTISLWMYRRDSIYTAIGASGGVCGVLFASIAMDPQRMIGFFFIPMPGWVFGILYLGYSVYGMKKSIGNIGHAAHLGGAVVGLLLAILFVPQLLLFHGYFIALMSLPIIALAYFVYKEK
ncbi:MULTISPECIES: rhomboid family intramembrane serine protease [unclassified Dysgonomonas]|uniref:rhomboid family intramembrane serine protease n=1 Tax=unclassified Dysgonomonas TaxID=2630389 RepID=UPI00068108BA|nr:MULTISPECIES: rhomboid family intramembrane serine protease [unclassified Dysgonomonas]MBD8347242.1 rhomboid family intramembrane serine protease [Dysgonomonas sp. HGC4]MBF0575001.1 rhomboid family intramembrane serine protease [Dysgonomonas sp. GY617]